MQCHEKIETCEEVREVRLTPTNSESTHREHTGNSLKLHLARPAHLMLSVISLHAAVGFCGLWE